jgi:hypothetical protein
VSRSIGMHDKHYEKSRASGFFHVPGHTR